MVKILIALSAILVVSYASPTAPAAMDGISETCHKLIEETYDVCKKTALADWKKTNTYQKIMSGQQLSQGETLRLLNKIKCCQYRSVEPCVESKIKTDSKCTSDEVDTYHWKNVELQNEVDRFECQSYHDKATCAKDD